MLTRAYFCFFLMIQAGGPELGLMLWESRGTMISLLEVCSCPYIPSGNSIFLKLRIIFFNSGYRYVKNTATLLLCLKVHKPYICIDIIITLVTYFGKENTVYKFMIKISFPPLSGTYVRIQAAASSSTYYE